MNCPLCQKSQAELFHRHQSRDFFLCAGCTIIFVPRSQVLTPAEEKKRYDAHQNDESDPQYRNYFLKTVNSVTLELRPGSSGLDFGCGRTRLMENLFFEQGFRLDSFDPFYFPELNLWERTYDFIIMVEVIEHLTDPLGTILELKKILKGPLFVRTKLYPLTDFGNWFYMRDPTHVQFFSMKALLTLGNVQEIAQDLYRIDLK